VNPIGWSNDDLPWLGGNTPLEVALREGAAIGYEGFELNDKFPKEPEALGRVLASHGVVLISGWYSGRLASRPIREEIVAIERHLRLLRTNGADVLVYGETADSIQGERRPLIERPFFRTGDEWRRYADAVTALADHTLEHGVRLAYHHHMGSYVQSPHDIDELMSLTRNEVGLLLDTGHCYMGGGDPLEILRVHGARVCHVHCKDVRKSVVEIASNRQWSFPECILNGVFTVPGDGDLDFEDIVGELLDRGYEGWLVVEAEQDPTVAPSAPYAKKGFEALHSILRRRAGIREDRT
jgi:inosose dehydratase